MHYQPQVKLPSVAGGPPTLLASISPASSLNPLLYRLGNRGSGSSEQGSAKTPIPAVREGYQKPRRVKWSCVLQQSWQWGTGRGAGPGWVVRPPDDLLGSPAPWEKASACRVFSQEKPYQKRWFLKAASCQTHNEMVINVGDFINFFCQIIKQVLKSDVCFP